MVTVPIFEVGRGGIVKDIAPHELPPEFWSDGQNVRFENRKVIKSKGSEVIFDPPGVAPYWTMYAPGLTDSYWIYAGAAKVRVVNNAGTHTDITRSVGGDYGMDDDLLWNGGILGGIPLLNNGVDVPQRWATISSGTLLDDLPNWPASTTARIIRPFKSFFVALDITLSGTRSPHKVKWSHSADPGTIPDSWDETDATKDAGETELTDAARGFLIDALPLGDLLMIYKQGSVWGMQFIGGNFIFRFFPVFSGVGAFSKHCIAQVGARGTAQHFFFTGDDLIVHDGRTYQSVINERYHRWLVSTINTDKANRAFCVTNYPEREVWFCFPSGGADWPNLALVWSWENNSLSVRELENASFIGIGDVTEDTMSNLTWNSDTDAWDTDVTRWTSTVANPNQQQLLQCDPVSTKLRALDRSEQLSGINMSSFIERTGLAIAGQHRDGTPKVDYSVRKLVNRIWPRVQGGPVSVRIGSQDDADDPVMWASPQVFDPGSQQYLDFAVNGRLIAVRFESIGVDSWELEGYDLELEGAGRL